MQFDLASDSGRLCRGCYKDVKTALDATRVDLEAQAAAPRTRGQHVAGDAAAAQLALLPHLTRQLLQPPGCMQMLGWLEPLHGRLRLPGSREGGGCGRRHG